MSLVCAVATDDGSFFSEEHFGDAGYYLIYEIGRNELEYVERIENTSIHVEGHAVPEKAQSVTSILKVKGVQVLVASVFGPNIKRVKSHFVPVIIKKNKNIQDALVLVQTNYEALKREWETDDAERKHIIL